MNKLTLAILVSTLSIGGAAYAQGYSTGTPNSVTTDPAGKAKVEAPKSGSGADMSGGNQPAGSSGTSDPSGVAGQSSGGANTVAPDSTGKPKVKAPKSGSATDMSGTGGSKPAYGSGDK